MDFNKLSFIKNKTFLFIIFIIILLVISIYLYNNIDEKDKKRYKTSDIIINCVVPGLLIGGLIVSGLWFIELPSSKEVFLEEDFWS